MAKKTVADIDLKGKKVVMRCDFNVPLDDNLNITSDDRIVKALPSIKQILDNGGAVILMSHLGRPEGERVEKLSLAPVAKRLGELLERQVVFADDCIGPDVEAKAAALQPGDVMLPVILRAGSRGLPRHPALVPGLPQQRELGRGVVQAGHPQHVLGQRLGDGYRPVIGV